MKKFLRTLVYLLAGIPAAGVVFIFLTVIVILAFAMSIIGIIPMIVLLMISMIGVLYNLLVSWNLMQDEEKIKEELKKEENE